MKTEILKLLRESQDYVSGQQLCETFGVSRTAVWKVMNQLKEGGRGWDSPSGSSIYMSIMLRPKFPPVKAPMLTIVMAYSVARALRTCTGLDVQIKWPNDIILNGKKIVGILTEMSTEIDYINHVVIGVGINVNTETFPEEIADKATSLRIEIGEVQKRAPIVAEIMSEFEKCYEEFEKQERMSAF